MELTGTRFGDITYEQKDLLVLDSGLIGMPDQTEFLILDFEDDMPFKWLQSTRDASLGFLVGDPLLFRPDYQLALSRAELGGLDVKSPADLAVFVLCTMKDDIDYVTEIHLS